MNIGILGSRGFPSTYGGYETLVRHLSRWLVAREHNVTVYCRTRDDGRGTWVAERVMCVATPGIDSKSISTLSYGLTSALHASWARFDAMLVLNIANGLYLPLLERKGIPTAVNTDGLEWERAKWGPVAKAAFRLGARMTARHATALVADSEAMADVWRERFGVDSTFIPYGARVLRERRTEGLQQLGLEPDRYLLVVARLIPENNVELALDAVDRLGKSAPPTVIVGSANFDNPTERRLRDMQAAGRVLWLGHVDDQELLTRLWAHAGVYFHGHSVGGTNPALLQALGAGAPVLALDTVFSREVLRSHDQLVPADPAILASRIVEVLASSEQRAVMRAHGQQTVAHRYQWEDVCRRYFEVLRGISR